MEGTGGHGSGAGPSVTAPTLRDNTVRTRARHGLRRGSPSRAYRVVTSNLFLGLVLSLLTWPTSINNLIVAAGDGSSWRSAVTMAARYHMAFGSRVVFTFGPLGFLVSPELFFTSTSALAFVFTLVFSTALYGTLVWSLRRIMPWPVAVVVAYFVGGISLLSSRYFGTNVAVEDVLALVLIVCVSVLSQSPDERAPVWIWISLGGVLGILSLVKLSLALGIVVAELITVTCLSNHRRQAVGALALGAVPLFCLGWFGTGNGFQNLIPFARTSVDVIGGYGAAMAYEQPGRGYTYLLAALALVLVGMFAVAHCRGLSRRSQIGIGLVTLATMWFLFKEAFVRHDSHDLVFFVAAPVVLAAFSPRWRSPVWLISGMLGLVIVAAVVGGSVPAQANQPVRAVRDFFDQATTLASSHRRAVVIAQSRGSLLGYFAPPNQMVQAMQGSTGDVSPLQQTVIWAHPGIHFDPLPVLQDYTAFTPSLDQLDTDFLRSSKAPRYILREPATIDGRNPAFDPPATQLAIECRYREVAVSTVWQLLERRANRCGDRHLLTTVSTGLDHWVTVPSAPAGDEVVASFQLATDFWSRLESLVYKPPNVYLAANDGQATWRFVAATGPDLHVLRASSALGYSPPFVPAAISSLRFSIDGESRGSSGIKISFYDVPMAAVSAR